MYKIQNQDSYFLLRIINRNDLIDPSDEGGNLNIDARYILAPAAKAPAD